MTVETVYMSVRGMFVYGRGMCMREGHVYIREQCVYVVV